MFNPKITCGTCGVIEFLFMALAIIERNQGMELMLGRDLIGQRDGIQPARADDNRLHSHMSFVFLTWCYDRGTLHRSKAARCATPSVKRQEKTKYLHHVTLAGMLGF